MKSRFELSIIVIIGLLVIAILYFVFSDNEQISVFKYKSVEYDDLVSRQAKLGLYAVPENYEKQICFSIPNDNAIDSQVFLSEYIDEISDIREDIKFSDTPPEFHTRFDTQVKTSLALEMIDLYDFDATVIDTYNNVGKIPDRLYYFDCPFEYEDEQMMLRILFESHFWENMPVYVNATRNNIGIPTLTNDNITVFVGGINSTVLFQNNFEREITIRATDPVNYQRNENDRYFDLQEPERLFENKFVKITNEDKITIPPGKAFSYHFASWGNPHSIPLNYTISPSDLKGTVTVIPYYDCAPSKDIFLPYSKVHKIPESPLYLPDGYKYQCGFYHYPEAATYYYANSMLGEKFKEKIGHGVNPEFLASGGLAIRLADMQSYGMVDTEQELDKFTRLAERFSSQSMTMFLNGQPAVLEKSKYGENLFGRITIYLDYDTWYIIEGGIPFSELYKIAESIPIEKGDGSLSILKTFDNPFKDKSLILELIDVKEVYHPGQLMSFEIFTQGHIPESSHLVVVIQDSNGNTVWQNNPSVDIGDLEIGYVDYTWSTEYDLGEPQILDSGDYIMTASWNDVSIQHEFQIRDEVQFSLLEDMIPKYAHQEDFVLAFDNDCSRKKIDQMSITKNLEKNNQEEIRDKLKENDQFLNFIFEKQEVITNDEIRTFAYEVPVQVISCIENLKSDRMNLVEILKTHGEEPEYNIQLLLRESEIFYHGHEYQQAIETADFILENLDSNNADGLILKGNSLKRLGQYEKAIETYKITIENDPNFTEGWFRSGHALSSNDQHDLAIQHFDQAIKIDPNYADAYIGKAFTLLIMERYDDALDSAEKAVEVNPDIPVYREMYQTILKVSESQSR